MLVIEVPIAFLKMQLSFGTANTRDNRFQNYTKTIKKLPIKLELKVLTLLGKNTLIFLHINP